MSRFELMHGDIPVAELELSDADRRIISIISVQDPSHMPMGTVVDGLPSRDRLSRWWSGRTAPISRLGVRDLLDILDAGFVEALLPESLGLSLSDHYWVRPPGSGIRWDDVSLFVNGFSDDVGDILLGSDKRSDDSDLRSPDLTTSGRMRKRWRIVGGKRVLLKLGTRPFRQEPYNEVIASWMAEAIGLPAVRYEIVESGRDTVCMCQCFTGPGSELVSANQVMLSKAIGPGASGYNHYVGCCHDHGIDIVPFLDRMLVLDYIIANTDRHFGNFGILRDPEAMEWIGPAPVFDSGSSLGFDLDVEDIVGGSGSRCKPFRVSFSEQIELVSDWSAIDTDPLHDVIDRAGNLLSGVQRYVERGRDRAITELLESRLGDIESKVRHRS